MSLPAKELTCATWADLEREIEALVGPDPYQWLFRGHQQASWQLAPRIERECSLAQLVRTEFALYEGFRSKAHLYTTQLPPLEDTVSWLAAMQHHGIPTRLLDWSYSAYVALFLPSKQLPHRPGLYASGARDAVGFASHRAEMNMLPSGRFTPRLSPQSVENSLLTGSVFPKARVLRVPSASSEWRFPTLFWTTWQAWSCPSSRVFTSRAYRHSRAVSCSIAIMALRSRIPLQI
jgi:hypothetical protein